MNENDWLNKPWDKFYKEYYDEFIKYIKPITEDSDESDLMVTSFYNGATFAWNIANWWMQANTNRMQNIDNHTDELKPNGE